MARNVFLILVSLTMITMMVVADHILKDDAGWERGKLIDGVPIMKRLVRNVYQCSQLCTLTKSCVSFSYDESTRFCTIMSRSIEESTLRKEETNLVHRNVLASKKNHLVPACNRQPCGNDKSVCVETGNSRMCVDQNDKGFFSVQFSCESHFGYLWSTSCGICYKFNTTLASRPQAQEMCERNGGHLLKIDSSKKQECISNIINSDPVLEDVDRLWIGADDSLEEGMWRWADGSLAEFLFWAPTKPDGDSDDEDYAIIYTEYPNKWNDFRPHRQFGSICYIKI